MLACSTPSRSCGLGPSSVRLPPAQRPREVQLEVSTCEGPRCPPPSRREDARCRTGRLPRMSRRVQQPARHSGNGLGPFSPSELRRAALQGVLTQPSARPARLVAGLSEQPHRLRVRCFAKAALFCGVLICEGTAPRTRLVFREQQMDQRGRAAVVLVGKGVKG